MLRRWDASCSETREWQDDAGVQDLESKGDQPFYLVLVDWGDALSGGRDFMSGNNLVVYAAQEMLSVPEVRKSLQCSLPSTPESKYLLV